jgi:hypothetical protein
MHNYWLGIMAAGFVVALSIWLLLVFNADRHPRGRPQESLPHREVIGGEFEARDGGRQVMPIPAQPGTAPAREGEGQPAGTRLNVPAQAGPAEDATAASTGEAADRGERADGGQGAPVPQQRGTRPSEQAADRAERS